MTGNAPPPPPSSYAIFKFKIHKVDASWFHLVASKEEMVCTQALAKDLIVFLPAIQFLSKMCLSEYLPWIIFLFGFLLIPKLSWQMPLTHVMSQLRKHWSQSKICKFDVCYLHCWNLHWNNYLPMYALKMKNVKNALNRNTFSSNIILVFTPFWNPNHFNADLGFS